MLKNFNAKLLLVISSVIVNSLIYLQKNIDSPKGQKDKRTLWSLKGSKKKTGGRSEEQLSKTPRRHVNKEGEEMKTKIVSWKNP